MNNEYASVLQVFHDIIHCSIASKPKGTLPSEAWDVFFLDFIFEADFRDSSNAFVLLGVLPLPMVAEVL